MPKIQGYTPPWLARPSPGFELLSPQAASRASQFKGSSSNPSRSTQSNGARRTVGSRRTIARRPDTTEVFVAVGNQIRWTDLRNLKDSYERHELRKSPTKHNGHAHPETNEGENGEGEYTGKGYKVLALPLIEQDIQQLVISPNGTFLAILTSTNVYALVIPDSHHVTEPDFGPVKATLFPVGTEVHRADRSPVVSVRWHPLSESDNCLVTVTADGILQVFEFAPKNRLSFQDPSSIIHLASLAEFEESGVYTECGSDGNRKGFGLDAKDIDVASISFGGEGTATETGWDSFTLWIATTEGDIYTLCPLIPRVWRASPTLIPSLKLAVAAKKRAFKSAIDPSEEERYDLNVESRWIQFVERMYPVASQTHPTHRNYARPNEISSTPRLQGPYRLEHTLEEYDDESTELADIYTIGGRVDGMPDPELEGIEHGINDESLIGQNSLSIICLLTKGGRLHVCLDPNGVRPKWLGKHSPKPSGNELYEDLPELLPIESLDTLDRSTLEANSWPHIVPDPASHSAIFVIHTTGITYLSFKPWAERVHEEVWNGSNSGILARMANLRNFSTLREKIVDFRSTANGEISGCIVLEDVELGYFLLAANAGRPMAVEFDWAASDEVDDSSHVNFEDMASPELDPFFGPRIPYEPSALFERPSRLTDLLSAQNREWRQLLTDNLRFSPAILGLMTEAHNIVSNETIRLQRDVQRLFEMCTILKDELTLQIKTVKLVQQKLDAVLAQEEEYEDGEVETTRNERIEQRLRDAKARQSELLTRMKAAGMKLKYVGKSDISEKEREWITELEHLEAIVPSEDMVASFDTTHSGYGSDDGSSSPVKLSDRFIEAQRLTRDLVEQANHTVKGEAKSGDEHATPVKVSSDIRRKKVDQVRMLLERESVLVDAAKRRLQNLSLNA